MKKPHLFMSILLSMCFIGNSYSQTSTTNNFQASAQLAISCTISSESVSFGVLMQPLSSQGSTGHIEVLCSKDTPYNISLAYGGIFGVGPTTVYKQALTIYTRTNDTSVALVSDGNTVFNYFRESGPECTFANNCLINAGYSKTGTTGTQSVLNGFCKISQKCDIYQSTNAYIPLTSGYAYSFGVMRGINSGDTVPYSIYLPDDSSKVWNVGNFSYDNTGSGSVQNIPLRSSIRSDVTNGYITPDMYMDTVTAKMNF